MQALAARVDKHRRHDTGPKLLAAQRRGTNDLLAHVRQAAAVEGECDALLEDRRIHDRGNVAAPVAPNRILLREENRASAQPLGRIEAFDADEAPTLGRDKFRALLQLTADEGLRSRRHLPQAKILKRVAMIELEAGDVALLDAWGGECFEPVGFDA